MKVSIWKATSGLGLSARLHLWVRTRIVPWGRVVEAFDPAGRSLLDVGCGHGLLAFLLAGRGYTGAYTGIDIDPRKTKAARAWLGTRPYTVFSDSPLDSFEPASFDQIAVMDVLYLLPRAARGGFVSRAAELLEPGGALVALTSGGGPAWKRRMDRIQENLAVNLGITRGETVEPCDGREIAGHFSDSGLGNVRSVYVGRGYSHGFDLVVGFRTAGSGESPRR